MLLNDGRDGFSARRRHAESDLGRRLDSYADYAANLATVVGLCLLWPAAGARRPRGADPFPTPNTHG